MPLFISDEELSRLSNDVGAVAERADAYIRQVYGELETANAKADAASITAEQTCSLLEQKFLSLSGEFSSVQSQNSQLQSSLDERLAELAEAQAQKHSLHLQSIGKDGDIERLKTEVSELHKSKRQLLELVEQKDSEISEKNATIQSYLDKILKLGDSAAQKEARSSEIEAELVRSQAACTRLSQEKELVERHNAWLNEELTAKVDSLVQLRRTHSELESDMSAKLDNAERQYNECSSSLNWHKERLRELENQLTSVQEELCSSKEAAAANEERFSAELSTVNKLVELYKESSEEWSRKAGELEGVIKALETHLNQVENDYKERLEKETTLRAQFEKENADLKVKLEKCEAEIENSRKANELNLVPLSSFSTEISYDARGMDEDNHTIIPKIPANVSGTALAASLLRDGWSLAKMYTKYQEAVDALRHEQLGRKESESILQRVLCELEEKAVFLMDERAEYERMVEAYSTINQKLQSSLSEQLNLEKMIQGLKAELKRHERGNNHAQKEIADLQKQVAILLKECRDIQLRCGSAGPDIGDDDNSFGADALEFDVESDAERVISQLLTFKDINGLVEQNVKLRTLVRTLSDQIENKEIEFKENLELELRKQTDDAASKVAAVLQRAEEQGRMIESLHASVAMYRKLYEEEHKLRSSSTSLAERAPDTGRKDLLLLFEGSEEASKKAQEKAAERLRCLEEDLAKARSELILIRSERDKLALEAKFSREKLDSVIKDAEHQRDEMNGVLARNVEFSQLIVDYQKKLRESSESLNAAEELSRKSTMEASLLKFEKEILSNAEKRACDEVRSLSERVHRLQASLDTIQSAEEVRQEARAAEKKKQEEYVKQVEREWAEAKKQLQEERDVVRTLTSDREQTLKNTMNQVEDMRKELSNTLHACATAEARAAVAEARLSDLEKQIRSSDMKISETDDGSQPASFSPNEVVVQLRMAKEEVQRLKEEAETNKNHMLQFKSIAQVNEDALRQMEHAHENFKIEAEKLQKSLESELLSLRERVSELENETCMKSQEVASATAGKEEALFSALAEITSLKEDSIVKFSQIGAMEIQLTSLKEDLEKEHEKWRTAQSNYERQVILQSETIQELTKTSEKLSSLQKESSELRRMADILKSENVELKAKWESERSILEESKKEAEKKYVELNDQNKILHSRLEALHIQLAEKDRGSAGIPSGSTATDPLVDPGLQNVINYLRRSKEIAETEISLLKQEKHRLQSQLDGALKASENAQASLYAERASSRALLLTEEEIKSLQLQVREMNLLRESNMQLREENKHNFEECLKLREVAQKASIESEILKNQLMERQVELEASRKEIEMHQAEKAHLEKRVSELLERCRNIDLEEYDRLKSIVQQTEEKLKEKDAKIEEVMNLLSKKQETVTQLEQDLAKIRSELGEREKRLNDTMQLEANLKMEQRRLMFQKKKVDALSKEKDQISKENQALTKQLEELKQGKRSISKTTGDQATKEKEEKDTRIQMLEKTIQKYRDDMKKEKDEHQTEKANRLKSEKAISESVKQIEKGMTTVLSELVKHQQALKRLSEELEKLRHVEGNLPEGSSVVQLAGTILDDQASYLSATEDFEKAVRSVLSELGIGAISGDSSTPADTSEASQSVPEQAHIASSTAPVKVARPAKAADEREKRLMPKTHLEARKIARRLIRPSLSKSKEQGDVEMSESSHDAETQGTPTQPSQQVRKRPASTTPESNEDSSIQVDSSSDVIVPAQKKSKGLDSSAEASESQVADAPESLVCPPVMEEADDGAGDLVEGLNEEAAIEGEKDEVEPTEETVEDTKEPEVEATNEEGEVHEKNDAEDTSEKPNETAMMSDEQDNQNAMVETESEKEEGELGPDDTEDVEVGADMSNVMASPETGEGQTELGSTPAASPSRVDEKDLENEAAAEENVTSPEVVNEDTPEEGELAPDDVLAEASDKSKDGSDPTAAAASVTGSTEEVKPQVSPSVVNISDRAREFRIRRLGGTPDAAAPAPAPAPAPAANRGRGRPPQARGRAASTGRGPRTWSRGQNSGQQ